MRKIISIGISVGLAFAGAGLFYHYVVVLPSEQAREEIAKQQRLASAYGEEVSRVANYAKCLHALDDEAKISWTRYCSSKGEPARCGLTPEVGQRIEMQREKGEISCFNEAGIRR